MLRAAFDDHMIMATETFSIKPVPANVCAIFWEEFKELDELKFAKALAYTAAYGKRLTIDNLVDSLALIRAKECAIGTVKSACLKCNGTGIAIKDNLGHRCDCGNGKNHPHLTRI